MPEQQNYQIHRLIQHTESGLFYKKPGLWVRTRAEASHFSSFEEVLGYCQENDLKDVEYLLIFDGVIEHDLSIPILISQTEPRKSSSVTWKKIVAALARLFQSVLLQIPIWIFS